MGKLSKRCPRGRLLRALMRDGEMGANVIPLRVDPAEERTRLALISAGKAYCVAKCGGCELTREPGA